MNWKEIIESKIYTSLDKLTKTTDVWKMHNEQIVFTNGCFDLIHKGHLDYLSNAAGLGDRFVIGLNADVSVKILKGEKRPIYNEDERALKLASLLYVDAVVLFEEETPLKLIKTISPTTLAKGGDYTIETIVGSAEVLAYGGNVEVIPFLEGYSSTAIIEKIKNS